jgi:hypothetical protein
MILVHLFRLIGTSIRLRPDCPGVYGQYTTCMYQGADSRPASTWTRHPFTIRRARGAATRSILKCSPPSGLGGLGLSNHRADVSNQPDSHNLTKSLIREACTSSIHVPDLPQRHRQRLPPVRGMPTLCPEVAASLGSSTPTPVPSSQGEKQWLVGWLAGWCRAGSLGNDGACMPHPFNKVHEGPHTLPLLPHVPTRHLSRA